jgi:Ca2+-binding EF-hand superfamily protein
MLLSSIFSAQMFLSSMFLQSNPKPHTLTEQEDAECRECFNLFDRDKDGKISISELGLIMRSLGRAPTELEVKDYMKSIDIKGTGSFDINGLLEVSTHSNSMAMFHFDIFVYR